MTNPKTLITSWTFWFGIAQILLAFIGFFGGQMDQNSALTLAMTGLGTIGFRLKTSQPISSVT